LYQRFFWTHKSPDQIFSFYSFYHEIEMSFSDLPTDPRDLDHVDQCFMSFVAREIREHGFVSGSKARELGLPSSASQALSEMYKDKYMEDVEKEDHELASKALSWACEIEPEWSDEYLNTIKKVAQNAKEFGTIHYKMTGYAASIIPAYQRSMAKEREIKECTQVHVGTIKKRQVFKLQLVREAGYETQWGFTSIYIFQDEDGNKLVWKTGTYQDLEEGKWYEGKATVKDHDYYQGKPQTLITRCKLEEISQ